LVTAATAAGKLLSSAGRATTGRKGDGGKEAADQYEKDHGAKS